MSIRRLLPVLLVLPLLLLSPASPSVAGVTAGDKVVVYYFHQTVRCSTCLEFETFSKKTLDSYFAKEMAGGRVEWQVLNMDLPANRHYADEFKLFTKALVIEKVHDGQPVARKNLEDIWAFEGDEAGFTKLVKDAVAAYL